MNKCLCGPNCQLESISIDWIAFTESHMAVVIELIVTSTFAESHVPIIIESFALVKQIVIVHQQIHFDGNFLHLKNTMLTQCVAEWWPNVSIKIDRVRKRTKPSNATAASFIVCQSAIRHRFSCSYRWLNWCRCSHNCTQHQRVICHE